MTCGIYKLAFNGTTDVYIGQSVNIEKRIIKHKYLLYNSKASKKLQKAFEIYGMFNYEILEICKEEELDFLEKEIIEIYDSYNNGLNSTQEAKCGYGLSGETHPGAKFSNEQIITCFNLLINNPELTYKDIADITETNKSLLTDIVGGKRHTWLKTKFPNEYPKLKLVDRHSGKNSAKNLGKKYPPIMSPDGKVYEVTNASSFSREHNLHNGHLSDVLNRKAHSIKGWKLVPHS